MVKACQWHDELLLCISVEGSSPVEQCPASASKMRRSYPVVQLCPIAQYSMQQLYISNQN